VSGNFAGARNCSSLGVLSTTCQYTAGWGCLLPLACLVLMGVWCVQQPSFAIVKLCYAAELLAGCWYHMRCYNNGCACALPQLVSAEEASHVTQLLTGVACCHMRWCALS
jgi:hypothetical protein